MTASRRTAYLCLALLTFSSVACLVNMSRSVHDNRQFGGTDLRVRVVGARALMQGINPYTLENQNAPSDRLIDPDRGRYNRCTYPPTLLSFYVPLAGLAYPSQRTLWMILEWAAILVSIGLLASQLNDRVSRCSFLAVAVGLFAGSQFWRLHVERGQYYVFVLLLLSLGIRALRRRESSILAGMCFGLAVCLRPPVICFLLPLWWSRHRKSLASAALTVVCGVLLSLSWGGISYWSDFVSLSRSWETSILDGSFTEVSRREEPREVDGYRPEILAVPAPNLSVASLVHDKLPESLRERPQIPATAIKIAWGVLTVLLLFVWLRPGRGKPRSLDSVLLCGTTLVLLTDYFLPIRISYADILFLIPLALHMPTLLQRQNRPLIGAIVLAFLPSLFPVSGLPWQYWFITTALRSFVTLFVIVRLLLNDTSTSAERDSPADLVT